MRFEKDIKKLVKEKNRLAKIREGIGAMSLSNLDASYTDEAVAAKKKIRDAIAVLHEAELILRNFHRD